jgi:hypothetical protein
MNPAGIVLVVAGLWIVSQVFAGNALQRLNIVKPTTGITSDGLQRIIPDSPAPWLPGGSANPVLPTV